MGGNADADEAKSSILGAGVVRFVPERLRRIF